MRALYFALVLTLSAAAAQGSTLNRCVVNVVPLAGGADVQSMAGGAEANLGTVSANAPALQQGVRVQRHAKTYSVITQIGLRATGCSSQNASLQAFLDTTTPGVTVRIDSVTLSTAPQTFAPRIQTNTLTAHSIEIEIPNTMNPALVPNDIPLEFGATEE